MTNEQIYKCPQCGAEVSFDDKREKAFCSYCGSKILLKNDNEQIHRYIDDADLTRAETERMIKLQELQLQEKEHIEKQLEKEESDKRTVYMCISNLIILIGSILLRWIIKKIGGEYSFIYYLLKYVIVFDVIIFIFVLILLLLIQVGEEYIRKDEELNRLGYISLPTEVVHYDKMKYTDIKKILENVGFSNISCVPVYDLTTGLLTKPKTIYNISVNGQDTTMGITMKCAPDSKIVISYHELASKGD